MIVIAFTSWGCLEQASKIFVKRQIVNILSFVDRNGSTAAVRKSGPRHTVKGQGWVCSNRKNWQ